MDQRMTSLPSMCCSLGSVVLDTACSSRFRGQISISKHNRGCAVDLSMYDVNSGQEVEMPSVYDEMSPRAYPTYEGGPAEARQRRDTLRAAMEREGFTVEPNEWWHFNYKDWTQYPILDVAFGDIAPPAVR
jgi:D-alanyl-D-alanine dipeptidase